MKLAAIHCWVSPGGALEVLKDLIKEENRISGFSDIKIFTSYSEIETILIDNKKIKIITAIPKRLNIFFKRNTKKKIPILGQIFDYRNLMFFYPLLMKIISRKIKRYKPNKILISSFAIAKNIQQCKTISKENIDTTLYLHSPMQYIRSHSQEYQQKLTGRKGRIFRKITPRLQKRDLQYTKYDKVYSNSTYTKNLAKKIYNIESEVKYPKINQTFLNENIIKEPQEYIVCVGRIVKFVREIDLIVKAFNKLNYPLIIIGSGPDEKEIKKLAQKNITFTGRKDPITMIDIIKNAKGTINMTKESFGISTAECLCLGVPVLGYNEGATPELVDKESGILIKNKTDNDIITAFKLFISTKRDRNKIAARAKTIFIQKQ
ncbi:group 1 glycosyl transferase [candidate division SR1 bacterium RAAC1_SR1_1]|nr:group 1 glycosyl transferase [candidate division SR1 bacterium RAAC1_SR1_1]